MRVLWNPPAWDDYLGWQERDASTFKKINSLIKECRRTPFTGSGKPEPLKGELRGWWSRRINESDRLVYRVAGRGSDQTLEVLQCKGHY